MNASPDDIGVVGQCGTKVVNSCGVSGDIAGLNLGGGDELCAAGERVALDREATGERTVFGFDVQGDGADLGTDWGVDSTSERPEQCEQRELT
jgi:hypothetical protein